VIISRLLLTLIFYFGLFDFIKLLCIYDTEVIKMPSKLYTFDTPDKCVYGRGINFAITKDVSVLTSINPKDHLEFATGYIHASEVLYNKAKMVELPHKCKLCQFWETCFEKNGKDDFRRRKPEYYS